MAPQQHMGVKLVFEKKKAERTILHEKLQRL
jgi:hypothetical protein